MYFSWSPVGSSSTSTDNEDPLVVEFDSGLIVEPYNFEPSASESSSQSSDTQSDEEINERMLDYLGWFYNDYYNYVLNLGFIIPRCACGNCAIMNSPIVCVCCKETQQTVNKIGELNTPVHCITVHPGFLTVVWMFGFCKHPIISIDNIMDPPTLYLLTSMYYFVTEFVHL